MATFSQQKIRQLLVVGVSTILVVSAVIAQDLSVVAIIQPTSGCALTDIEPVTISIFNFGPTLTAGSSFNVSYIIGAGSPVTELVVLGSNILTNSTFNYSFSTLANLSTPGSYSLTGVVSLVGDINPTNNALTGYTVTNSSVSAGNLTGSTSVTYGANSGTLSLSGNNGPVDHWELSPDGGTTWFVLANATNTQSYLNLRETTSYRVAVVNGSRAMARTAPATITVTGSAPAGPTGPTVQMGQLARLDQLVLPVVSDMTV